MQVVLKNNNFGEVEDCYNIGENFEDYGDFEECLIEIMVMAMKKSQGILILGGIGTRAHNL